MYSLPIMRIRLNQLAVFVVALALFGGLGEPLVRDAASADVSFLSALEDVPLMPGLTEDKAQGVVFDTPDGRIVESVANGKVAVDRVKQFYAAVLPQLGWQSLNDLAGDMAYGREGEVLAMTVRLVQGGVVVRYAVSPSGQ
ncbi:MAG: hypothetical protein HOK61_09395 [Alphaproteobacteria bacterium]|jgi:hypothetical protein|nr:hypothetical protein [Alphaproteobacteria bacterium]